ncbi:hypothetical protein [Nocardia mexicana]|uniref:Secreted protein n=1 Tax=Nocardia mexicana TaxID=279262 RepID=A0A370GVL4_9NOCA|nr:hypothetical protein [Nocardia mexicana]RDI46624.1 hypothetical protein DFR68_11029 [Nocardia mexicana]
MLRATAIFLAAGACSLLGLHQASATPPIPSSEPSGAIRMDLAPGEWWMCQGVGVQPPYVQFAPGYYQFEQGPNPVYLRFTPGADVWVTCMGTGLPLLYYGPIVKAGE